MVEFTDKVKNDIKPVKHFQFEKETPQERAQREHKLEQIRKKNSEIDKRIKLQEQLDNERKKLKLKEQEIEKLKQQSKGKSSDENNARYYRGGRWYRPITKPRPKPVQPIEKPQPRPPLDPLAPARM